MKGNFKATEALVLLDSTSVAKPHLGKFSQSLADEFGQIARSDLENAVRAILVGIGLHAIKKSLAHGEFTAWKKKHLTHGHYWTETTAMKNASLYMRLAIHVIQDLRPPKGELLALTEAGTVTLAKLYQPGKVCPLTDRLAKHVGERCIQELLDHYGIKNGDGSTGGGAKAAAALPADDDTLAEDTGQLFLNFDQLLLSPDNLKRFPKRQILQLRDQVRDRSRKFEQLVEKILNQENS